jgi:ligand-binding sensor domain-containing protein
MVMIAITPSLSFALDPHKSIGQYRHNFWVRQNGLPANGINVALQTPDGYFWLGTAEGLFRFDGVSFKEIPTGTKNEESCETITSLCESPDGSLWIGTGYCGLRKYTDGKISAYSRKEGFLDTEIHGLLESREGYLYIATSIGLFTLREGKFVPVLLNPNYITALSQDSTGKIWVGTHLGIRILQSGSSKIVDSITTANGLPNDVTTFIYTDREGTIWIGTANGLVQWRNGTIRNYTVNDGLAGNHINTIHEDKDGNLWVGTEKGLSRLDQGKWTSYTELDGLTDNDVLGFAEGYEGSLWICTADGLNQFKDVNLTTYTTYDGLSNDYVSSIIEDQRGWMYFLSPPAANVTAMKNGKIKMYNIPVGPAYQARDGSIWIGQSGFLFNIKDGKLKQYDSHSGLPPRWISAITEDRQGLIVYIDHEGIFRFIHGHLQPYRMKDGRPYASKEYVVCFYPQRENLLWVGTADSLVKIENGASTSFTKRDGLAGNWVTSIYDDHQGNLWISSPQGGLTRYNNGKFTPYNIHSGLFTDEIYCVLGDDQGNLWLSSPKGIGRVSRQELIDYSDNKITSIHSQVYGVEDGMKTEECFGSWQPAGWKARDGRLWFATTKGAVMIDPHHFKKNTIPPPVSVEEVLVNDKPLIGTENITVPAGAKRFEFRYAALSFLAPDRVLFKYKLDGYDRNWVNAGTSRASYYTNLSPGEYRFQVIACNNDGVWNNAGANFTFTLEPHFYQTYWFISIIILIIAGMGFGIYRFRVWQLLKEEEELNARIKEAMANIKTLSGLIPICSNCKKIRNDKGFWDQLEEYIQLHSDAKFSHGICPDCAKKLYPDMYFRPQNPEV